MDSSTSMGSGEEVGGLSETLWEWWWWYVCGTGSTQGVLVYGGRGSLYIRSHGQELYHVEVGRCGGVDHWCLSSMGSPHKVSWEPAPPSLLKLLPVALLTSLPAPLCAWVLGLPADAPAPFRM